MRQSFLIITTAILWYGVGIFASAIRRSIGTDPGSIVKVPLFKRDFSHEDAGYNRFKDYLASVWIDGVRYDLVVDTTTADTWLFSNLINKIAIQKKKTMKRIRYPAVVNAPIPAEDNYQPVFDCKKAELKGQFKPDFNNGVVVRGQVGKAGVLAIGSIKVNDAAVQCASDYAISDSWDSRLYQFDGVLGLGPSEANSVTPKEDRPPRLFERAFGNKLEKAITIDLYDDFEWKDPLSRVVFNDCECYSRKPTPRSISADTASGKWEFTRTRDGRKVILDSSKDYITGTAEVVKDYYDDVEGAEMIEGSWYTPCNATLPGLRVPVSEDHMAFVDGKYLRGLERGGGRCLPGFQVMAQGWDPGLLERSNTITYGIPFFRSQTVCLTEISKLGSTGKSDKKTTNYQINICDKPK